MADRPDVFPARRVALSRTVFYDRWTRVMGEPPLAYLTRLRMVLARERLRGKASVAEVAASVGYGSEAAFSRAFRRHVGTTPTTWRQPPCAKRPAFGPSLPSATYQASRTGPHAFTITFASTCGRPCSRPSCLILAANGTASWRP